MSAIRLITFDLDDTLWPCLPVIQAAEAALFDWLREQAPRLTEHHDIASMRRHRHQLMVEIPEIAHDLGQLRHRSLLALLREHAYPAQLADAALAHFRSHRNRVQPYADVVPVLTELATRYTLVSVTNGNADVSATPLRGLFRHELTAAEAGAAKPHPALFRDALALTGQEPGDAVHVGDDPWLDVAAARACGMRAVWMDRQGGAWPAELAPPEFRVSDLHALRDWLTANA